MAEVVESVPASQLAEPVDDDVDLVPVRTSTARTWATLRRNPMFWIGGVIVANLLVRAGGQQAT